MKTNLKLKLLFANRAINIVSMEVDEIKGDKTFVYLEIERDEHPGWSETLFHSIRKIPDLIDIEEIRTLPQEKREKSLQVVLDSVSDGILSVNDEGELVFMNSVARRILNCADRGLVGQHIIELDIADRSVLACLEGKSFVNEKRNIMAKGGRYQYLASGHPIVDSAGRIVGAVEVMKDMKEVKELASAVSESAQATFSDIVGDSPALKEAIRFAQTIAPTDSTVCICGDNGTGKELFASAIHLESGRSGPFIPLNCAALPEQLLESELFGYVGGAFTGARKEGKGGLFEMASGGTLFLDEIGEMPLSLQAKLLRVLQEGKIRRIGGMTEIPVDARIITATNKDLEQMVAEKEFREDLYYRISVFPIRIPALKERREDIPDLAEHFLFQLGTKLNKRHQLLIDEAMNKLTRHDWPGNVRELRNVIERAAILCTGECIGEECILFSFEIGKGQTEEVLPAAEGLSLHEQTGRYEARIIADALRKSPSIRKAAKALGLSHTALLKKLKKHNLSVETK